MERHAFALRVLDGKMGAFRENLGKVWAELCAFLDAHGAGNFSMWGVQELVFGYFETSSAPVYTDGDWAAVARWEQAYGGCYEWISTPFAPMRLMYEDFGVVRESKELIRHRVFITKLRPGKEEDYKRAHDGLAAARHGQISPGPDSNFSIWYAGGYIFGYDEIDVTMEHEPTEAERQASITWETRMLELMRWVTDDIDWMLDERHAHIVRLAFHN